MSLWDQFELFLAVDAAGLAIPTNYSEKKALLNKMRDSYEKAVDEVFEVDPKSKTNLMPV